MSNESGIGARGVHRLRAVRFHLSSSFPAGSRRQGGGYTGSRFRGGKGGLPLGGGWLSGKRYYGGGLKDGRAEAESPHTGNGTAAGAGGKRRTAAGASATVPSPAAGALWGAGVSKP